MESLAALGLAGNVVQFVQFVSSLISSGVEIAHSAQGSTQHMLELDQVYTSLRVFTSSFRGPSKESRARQQDSAAYGVLVHQDDSVDSYIQALKTLTAECDHLCEHLLATVQRLRLRDGSYPRFKSFVLALKTLWNSREIKSLEERIDRFQKVISFNFFPLLSYQQSFMLNALSSLRDESLRLQMDQSTKLDQLMTRLHELKHSIPLGPSQGTLSGSEDNIANMTTVEVKSLTNGINSLYITEEDLAVVAKQQAFLKTLNFTSRPLRHQGISVAHQQTFGWIFRPLEVNETAKTQGASSFTNWLAQGNGIFWIAGKPGSGKSTLMKFITNHRQTRETLLCWAGSKKLVIPMHYFWTAGTAMQRSQKGLLQTLLYDIFRASPELIPEICPSRWSKSGFKPSTEASYEWTVAELQGALSVLSQLPTLPAKYCIFIDGIDEYEGEHFEICQQLKSLARSPSFKCCLSSRPFNIFEDSFGLDVSRKLYVENLTRRDILAYSRDKLKEHWRWHADYFAESEMEAVLDSIATKARGVFLWVFLVTKSLRQGLVDGDTLADLQRRLDSFPSDLEPFFKHMLDLVEPFYHQRMARILRIAVNAHKPLKLHIYQVHEYEEEDENYAIYKSAESHSSKNMSKTLDQCRRRIKARCGGLLEITNDDRVEFLHRTVRDFLFTREMSDYLLEKSGTEFKVNLSTLKAFILLFRCEDQLTDELGMDDLFWTEGLKYANDAIDESIEPTMWHLDAIEELYGSNSGCSGCSYNDFPELAVNTVFRSQMILAGVCRYVTLKLERQPDFFNNGFGLPLRTALDRSSWTQSNMNIIIQLLKSGQIPNAGGPQSPWRYFLEKACTLRDSSAEDNFRLAVQNSIFSMFIKHGAETDIQIEGVHGYSTAVRSSRFPVEWFVLSLFDFSCSHRLSNYCLGILADFLDASGEEQLCQLHEILSAELQSVKVFPYRGETERLRFFGMVAEKIIRRSLQFGQQLQQSMLVLPPVLRSAFPRARGLALAALIQPMDDSSSTNLIIPETTKGG